MLTRREFLKKTAIIAGGVLVPVSALEILSPERLQAIKADESVRWVFLVDTQRCVGCGFCVKACKLENDVPYEINATRTWVERYVLTKDGAFHADAPEGGRDGYITPELDLNESGHLAIDPETIDKAYFVPKLCNQCDNPPCVQVCPVGATCKTPDGVVLVDRKWCIGCGYCIMACPYGARFFHPELHTAEKCTFCYHRISEGLPSACVLACPFGARQIGNLQDPEDSVTRAISTGRVGVLKSEFGTRPQVYYVGLDWEVR